MRRGVLSASASVLTRPSTGLLGDTQIRYDGGDFGLDGTRPASVASARSLPHLHSLPRIAVRHRKTPPTADFNRSLATAARPRLGEMATIVHAESRRKVLKERMDRLRAFERQRATEEHGTARANARRLRELKRAADALRLRHEEQIAQTRQRQEERERQAEVKRRALLAKQASRAGAMFAANSRDFDEFDNAVPSADEISTPISPSQSSQSLRSSLAEDLERRTARVEEERRRQGEQQALAFEERRRLKESKTEATLSKRAVRQSQNLDHLGEHEHAVEMRLQARALAHEERVRESRRAQRAHMDAIYGRHEKRLESKLEAMKWQAGERARRYEESMAQLARSTRESSARRHEQRDARRRQQQQRLEEVLNGEEAVRQDWRRRQQFDAERLDAEHARQQSLATQRRLATHELARRRYELVAAQEKALCESGPVSGGDKLEKLLRSLDGLHAGRDRYHGKEGDGEGEQH